MPNEWTNADSLRVLNTGAASAGAPQIDPDASLGGYLASSQVRTMKYYPVNIPANIEILYVSAANGLGTGTVAFSGAAATWTAPGGTAGASVAIVNGETKVLEDGTDPEKYIRIRKLSTETSLLQGTLNLTWDENNAVVMRNVAEADALAGDSKYRAVGLSNGSAGAVTGVSVYSEPLSTPVVSDNEFLPATGAGELKSSKFLGVFPDACHIAIFDSAGALKEVVYAIRSEFGYAVAATGRGLCGTTAALGTSADTFAPVYGVELALETPTADAITAAADEDTPPTAISFTGAFSVATAVTAASIAAGDWVGLHLKRDTAAASQQIADILGSLRVVFTAGGTEYSVPFSGAYKVANAVQWQLFVSETTVFDFQADPDAVSAALPMSLPLTLPVSGNKNYWYAVRYRNRYGLTSLNQYGRKVGISSTGTSVLLAPSSPFNTTLEDSYEGDVKVITSYLKGNDEGYAANRWAIWASVGSDPDPDVDTPVKTKGIPDINLIGDAFELSYIFGPYASGADLRVVVRVYRSSDDVTDGNTDVITLTTASGAEAPEDILALM